MARMVANRGGAISTRPGLKWWPIGFYYRFGPVSGEVLAPFLPIPVASEGFLAFNAEVSPAQIKKTSLASNQSDDF
jgi:hypothetical protein